MLLMVPGNADSTFFKRSPSSSPTHAPETKVVSRATSPEVVPQISDATSLSPSVHLAAAFLNQMATPDLKLNDRLYPSKVNILKGANIFDPRSKEESLMSDEELNQSLAKGCDYKDVRIATTPRSIYIEECKSLVLPVIEPMGIIRNDEKTVDLRYKLPLKFIRIC